MGGQAASAALFQGLPSIGPALATAYALSLSEVGIVLGSVIFGMTVTLLPWGLASDRFGERRVIPLGLAGTAVALCAAAWSGGFLALVLALFVAGLWAASANAAGGRAVMGWFGPSERGLAMGIRAASVPAGGGLAALVLPPLADTWSPRVSLLALAAATGTAALATLVWLRDPPAGPPRRDAPPGPGVFRDPLLWRLVGVTLLLTAAQYAFVGFLVLFLTEARGVGLTEAALALVALQVASIVTRIAVGRWSDRIGSRLRPLRTVSMVAAGGLLATALFADAPAAFLVPSLVVGGLGAISWNALTFAASAELAPPGAAGTAIGVQNTALALSAAAFLPLFALVVETTSWTVGFATAGAAPLVALAFLRRMPDGTARERAPS